VLQNAYLLEANKGIAALLILVYVPTVITWYIAAFWRTFILFCSFGIAPSRKLDLLFFFALLTVILVSLFNLFWTFCWVTLGLLLDPERVVTYFVAFLTIFAVAFLKVAALVKLMKDAEKSLHIKLMKMHFGEIIKDEEIAETVDLPADKLKEFLIKKGYGESEVDEIVAKITKFRRFRVRFIFGNLIGAIFVLTALIVFIQIGVEAFRVSSGSGFVSGVGATLEALSGVSVAANQQLSDKKDEISGLVQRFSKKGAPIKGDANLEMTTVQS